MFYNRVLTNSFLQDIKTVKKNALLLERLRKKLDEIVQHPEHYPMKKYDLKGKRGVHVGSYVILFEIVGNDVVFLGFKHHDYAYY